LAALFVPLVLVVACEVLQLLAEIWPNLQKYIAFLGAAMVASAIFTPVIVLPYCCYLSFRRVRSQAAQPR
jgi:hypothetical protein